MRWDRWRHRVIVVMGASAAVSPSMTMSNRPSGVSRKQTVSRTFAVPSSTVWPWRSQHRQPPASMACEMVGQDPSIASARSVHGSAASPLGSRTLLTSEAGTVWLSGSVS